ncbi:MAG: heat-inducible transcription repressor HrcA, partial [Oscillospiraceae bacterium]|nr:heat-inducible transcription repressor HrcA [Oscillospiraceae bacterium]
MDDLSERALRVLSLVVEEYIATGEPVGSKTVTEKLGGAVSSATVRNDMAELAAHGLLDQPHTSAGRIPTAPAFRLYIDRLMRRRPLSPDARRAIDERLGAATDPADLLG